MSPSRRPAPPACWPVPEPTCPASSQRGRGSLQPDSLRSNHPPCQQRHGPPLSCRREATRTRHHRHGKRSFGDDSRILTTMSQHPSSRNWTRRVSGSSSCEASLTPVQHVCPPSSQPPLQKLALLTTSSTTTSQPRTSPRRDAPSLATPGSHHPVPCCLLRNARGRLWRYRSGMGMLHGWSGSLRLVESRVGE